MWDPNSRLNSAASDLKSIGTYQGRAQGAYRASLEMIEKIEILHPDWLLEVPYLKLKSEFNAKAAAFSRDYDAVALKETVKNVMSSAKDTLGFVNSYRKSNMSQAMGYLQQSEDKTNDIAANPQFTALPEVQEFLVAQRQKIRETKESINEELLKDRLKRAISLAMDNVSHAKTYFDSHRIDQSMEYFNKAQQYCRDVLSEPEFAGRPEVINEFLPNFQEKANAFEESFKADELAKRFKEVTELANGNLSHAFTYFDSHHLGQSLDYLKRAKDAHSDALCVNELYSSSTYRSKMDEFDAAFTAKANAFEEKFAAHARAEEKKSLLDRANTSLGHAVSYFASHHESQALEYFNNAKTSRDEVVRALPEDDDIRAFTVAFEEKAKAFEDSYNDRVVREAFKNKSSTAKDRMSFARQKLESQQYDQALEDWNQARRAAVEVSADPAIVSYLTKEVDAFGTEFNEKSDAFRRDFDDKQISNDLKAAISTANDNISHAFTYFASHHDSQALGYFNTAKEAAAAVSNNALFIRERASEVNSFEDAFREKADKFQEQYAERVLADALKAAESAANDNLSHAFSYFESHRDSQALEYFNTATRALSDLLSNEVFAGLRRVEDFADAFRAKAATFQDKFNERLAKDRRKQAESLVTDGISNAQTYFDSYRRDQSLEYLGKARNALGDYELDGEFAKEPDFTSFVEGSKGKIEAFERRFDEEVFKEEVKGALQSITEQLSQAKSALATDIPRALGCLNTAQSLAVALGTNDRYLNNQTVDDFLKTFATDYQALRDSAQAKMDAEAAKKAIDAVTTQLSNAKSYFDFHRRSQAIEMLNQARNALADIPSTVDAQTVADLETRVNELAEKFNTEIFNEEVTGIIRGAEAHLSTANSLWGMFNRSGALESLNQARETAERLAEPQYLGIKQVDAFFAGWSAKVTALQDKFNADLYADTLKELRSTITHKIRLATSFANQGMMAEAVQALRDSRDAIKAARSSSAGTSAEIVTFLAESEAECGKLEESINARFYANEFAQKSRDLQTRIKTANSLLANFAASQALEQYRSAKAEFATFTASGNFKSQPTYATFVEELSQQISKFETEFTSLHLGQAIRTFVSAVNPALNDIRLIVNRNIGAADAVKAKLSELDNLIKSTNAANPLVLQAPEAVAALQEIKTAKTAYARDNLLADSRKTIAAAEKIHRDIVLKHLERGLTGKAREAFFAQVKPLIAPLFSSWSTASAAGDLSPEALSSPNYNWLLTEVTAALDTFADFAKTNFDSVLYDPSTGSSSVAGGDGADSGASSNPGEPKTLLDCIGFLIESEEALRLPVIQMTVSINPDIYSKLKEYNQIAARLFTIVRRMNAGMLSECDYKKAVSPTAGRYHYGVSSMDEIELEKTNALKYIKWMEEGNKEDVTVKQLREAIDTFIPRAHALAEHLAYVSAFGKQVNKCCANITAMQALMKTGKSCLVGGTFPQRVRVEGVSGEVLDHDVFLTIEEKGKEVLRAVASREKFPAAAAFKKTAEKLIKEAFALHAKHCIQQILIAYEVNNRNLYMKKLRRWPKAREFVVEQWRRQQLNVYRRRYHELASVKPAQYSLEDADAGRTISDAVDETDHVYDTTSTYRPGKADAPVGTHVGQRKVSHAWSSKLESTVGQIVFSKAPIPMLMNEGTLATKFDAAKDEIFGRAVWAQPLRNYCLMLDDKEAPIYGPAALVDGHRQSHNPELLIFVSIDGKPLERPDQPGKAITYMRNSHSEMNGQTINNTRGNFWSFAQTCPVFMSTNAIANPNLDHETLTNRIRVALRALPPGDHTVKVDVCFSVVPAHEHVMVAGLLDKYALPHHATPISHPLATGSFTVTVPSGDLVAAIPLASMTRPRNPQVALGKVPVIEQAALDLLAVSEDAGKRVNKRENCFYAIADSNWRVCSTGDFPAGRVRDRYGNEYTEYVTEPSCYGIDMRILIYRTPMEGWPRESVACFSITSAAHEQRKPVAALPFRSIYWGDNYTFDASLLPEDMQALIADKRAAVAPELRDGILPLKDLPLLRWEEFLTSDSMAAPAL